MVRVGIPSCLRDREEVKDPNAAQVAAALPPVVLPQLWRALVGELSRWQSGGDWNNLLRIGPTGNGQEMALCLTQPRRFGAREAGMLPPQALLDGAGDEELLALLFEMEVTMLRAEVAPPPNTRHIAVRTGKRYGKTSLTARHGREPLACHAPVPLPARRAGSRRCPGWESSALA